MVLFFFAEEAKFNADRVGIQRAIKETGSRRERGSPGVLSMVYVALWAY